MKNLVGRDVREAKERVSAGTPFSDVVPGVLGGTLLDNGFWRFFGSSEPGSLSLGTWSSPDTWKHAWNGLASLTFWGEDVVGNQLLLDGEGNVYLWNHENALTIELGFDLFTILETCLSHGFGWVDFYSDGSYSLAKARVRGELPLDSHWHWLQPRTLGGRATGENLTPVERVQHLIGHGKLWLQLRDLPEGSRVIPKP